MKNAKRYTALLLCLAVVFSICSFNAFAVDVEVDLGDLFKPSTDDKPTEDKPTTDDSGSSDSTNAGDTTTDKKGSGGVTSIDLTSGDKKPATDDGSGLRKDDTTTEPTVYNSTFSDVAEDSWYYTYVTPLASKGIISGYPDGTFLPQNSITRAEFIKLLVATMGYELTESDEFTDVAKDAWYYSVVSTAVANKVIDKEKYGETFKPDEYIKRDEVAQLLVNATGAETGKYESPYVDTTDKNIVALYSICLMQGSKDDKTGDRYFFPETNVTRAETSAVFTRLLEYNADKDAFVKSKLEEYGITLKLLYTPTTQEDFYKSMTGVGINPASFFSFVKETDDNRANSEIVDSFILAYRQCSDSRPELFTLLALNVKTMSGYDMDKFTLNLYTASESYTLEQLMEKRDKALVKAQEIAKKILDENKGTDEYTLAFAIHDYLVLNTEYATESDDDLKYTAYGALIDGKSVCQGYASAFNLLCSLCGVKSCAVSTDSHVWNAVLYDNNISYFDCTFDDPVPDEKGRIMRDFCGVSAKKMSDTHGDFALPLAFYF